MVSICGDGIQAFDSILDEYPDIVMTDIKMPGLSGLELIQKVREAELNVEFVILSGYGEFEFAQTAMKYGVKYYLLKPCSEKEIIQVMHACIQVCQDQMSARLDRLLENLFSESDTGIEIAQRKFFTQLTSQQDLSLAKTQLLKLLMKVIKNPEHTLTTVQMAEDILNINSCDSMDELTPCAEKIMTDIFCTEPQHKYNDCVEKVLEYINANLSHSNLSLKWIAENYLYMNADYVSRQFVRQTGRKFSAYLTELRVREAKRLLLNENMDTPYAVAEKVGFGNNPQYFSQIFKKYTRLSPTAYVKKMTEG